MPSKRIVQRAIPPESEDLAPKPFDLRNRARPMDDHPAIGVFDRLYHVTNLDAGEVDTMALWLCHNCTQNFIFTECTTVILAGGSTNPLLSWQRRHIDRHHSTTESYQIKLDSRDITFFELTWLHGRGEDQ